MDQVLAIKQIREKIDAILQHIDDSGEGQSIRDSIKEAYDDLFVFLDKGIDFKEVVDTIDDSIWITDALGNVMYVNPAYESNTGIHPNEILGRNIEDIVKEGTLFTGGATMDVIKQKKKVFRLSTTMTSTPPQVGYTIGVPIFDNSGELQQVVVTSRPIVTLGALKEDFSVFVDELKNMKADTPVRIIKKPDEDMPSDRKIIGSSARLEKLEPIIERAAFTDATVLITGESGVGKEVIADEIYSKSNRKGKPYVKVNCASIPANLLESELFGYEKGAFSGANEEGKAGLFELANGGVLLLDEIGDMPIDMQVKLLRALQNKEIIRIGGTNSIDLDIRFIASTNSDLRLKIEEGSFRKDLYYRLSVIPIHLSPLRKRMDDLPDLCTFFIKKYSEQYHRPIYLSKSQLSLMELYDWPGNIRELENVIEYLTICSSGTGEVEDDVLKGILNFSDDSPSEVNQSMDLNVYMDVKEKEAIEKVLQISSSLREAAKLMNVNVSTVSRKIKYHNINYSKFLK